MPWALETYAKVSKYPSGLVIAQVRILFLLNCKYVIIILSSFFSAPDLLFYVKITQFSFTLISP